jgi:hypothetical protein
MAGRTPESEMATMPNSAKSDLASVVMPRRQSKRKAIAKRLNVQHLSAKTVCRPVTGVMAAHAASTVNRLIVAHARQRRWRLATGDTVLLEHLSDRERIEI